MRTMTRRSIMIAVALVTSFGGCTTDSLYRAVYESIRIGDDSLKSPPEQVGAIRPPSYTEYAAERKRLQQEAK